MSRPVKHLNINNVKNISCLVGASGHTGCMIMQRPPCRDNDKRVASVFLLFAAISVKQSLPSQKRKGGELLKAKMKN